MFLKVKNIVAPSNCSNFVSDNGILFDKDKTKIEFYPGGSLREEDSYTIPSSVTEIAPYAFFWATGDSFGLLNITIPSSVKKIGKYAFSCLSRFKTDGTLNFADTSGWHKSALAGPAVEDSDLTAANYNDNLSGYVLVRE
ncbi:MAG: leucine-rich repeat protein [Treponema sp.]|nr:leucine-rich repeat protein [Treponema sp.]MEE3436295.1 leucine-rich repeat protein [Treponema sp.]